MNPTETQPDRTDLPLVVVPTIFKAMIEPMAANLAILNGIARVRMYHDFTTDPEILAERCKDADAVVVIGFHVGGELLEQLSGHVRCFVFGGTGVANFIDLARCRELSIRVCNTVHYGDEAVGEYTFALIMELARSVGALDADTKAGGWAGLEGFTLQGKTLGLLGFGGIGQVVSRIANGFGMKTLVWNSHLNHEAVERLGVTPVDDIGELMESCDIASLHLPLTAETQGMITASDLNHLRPGSLLVNTARAELIEPGALLERLRRGDIRAALDVYDPEPLPADDPLRALPNVILTPHVAWRADDAYEGLTNQIAKSLTAFYGGGRFNVVQ